MGPYNYMGDPTITRGRRRSRENSATRRATFDPTATQREGARPPLPWRRRGGEREVPRCRTAAGAVEGDAVP